MKESYISRKSTHENSVNERTKLSKSKSKYRSSEKEEKKVPFCIGKGVGA